MSDDDDYSTEVESELRIAERKRRRQQRAGSPQNNKICSLCRGDRKDQLIVGMEIIRGVSQSNSKDGLWDGGEILDPQKGKTYNVMLTPIDGGAKLEVRGYVGLPLLGRTQTWLRVE